MRGRGARGADADHRALAIAELGDLLHHQVGVARQRNRGWLAIEVEAVLDRMEHVGGALGLLAPLGRTHGQYAFVRLVRRLRDARVAQRLDGGGESEAAGAPEVLAHRLVPVVEVLRQVEVLDEPGDPHLVRVGIECRDAADAALASDQRLPRRLDVVADGCDRADPGDCDTPHDPSARVSIFCRRSVSSRSARSCASIKAHMMSLASRTGRPSTVTRPDTTATSSLIESTLPSSSRTSPGRTTSRKSTLPIESRAARLRRSVVIITSQVPAWQSASRMNGYGMTGPSSPGSQ